MPTATPLQTETAGDPIVVTWRTVKFTVPPSSKWSVELFELLEDDKPIAMTRELLGADQWAKFKAADPVPTLTDLTALLTTITTAAGLGNSPASSTS